MVFACWHSVLTTTKYCSNYDRLHVCCRLSSSHVEGHICPSMSWPAGPLYSCSVAWGKDSSLLRWPLPSTASQCMTSCKACMQGGMADQMPLAGAPAVPFRSCSKARGEESFAVIMTAVEVGSSSSSRSATPAHALQAWCSILTQVSEQGQDTAWHWSKLYRMLYYAALMFKGAHSTQAQVDKFLLSAHAT